MTEAFVNIDVGEFEWDDDNLSHSRHGVSPMIAQEVRDGQPVFFRNKPGKAGTHVMVGPDANGRFWTIIIRETAVEGRWRPITGWPSYKPELRRYNDAVRQE